MGGPGQCCGVYQFREGDFANTARVGYTTIDGLAAAGTSTVLSWCPSCQVQIGEVALPSYEERFGARPFDLNPFLVFLADRADELAPADDNARREAGGAARTAGIAVGAGGGAPAPRRSSPASSWSRSMCRASGPRPIASPCCRISSASSSQRELAAVADAGVTTLATIYHACHRELCDVGDGRSFEVVNFMEILGEGLGPAERGSLQAAQTDQGHRRHHRRNERR